MSVAFPLPEPPRRSLREIVRLFLEQHTREGEVDVLDLIELAQERFRSDPEFLEAVLRDSLPLLITSLAQDFFHQRRNEGQWNYRQTRRRTPREKAERVFESVGDHQYRSLFKMNKRQLLAVGEQ